MLKAPLNAADVFQHLFHLLEGYVVIFHHALDKNQHVRVKYSKTESKEARNPVSVDRGGEVFGTGSTLCDYIVV